MKKTFPLRRVILSGLFAALIAVLTALLPIPLGHGFANPGDVFVLLSGFVLGPVFGFLSAGIGSMLADLFLGYAVYAPATFLIKGLMALVAALLSRAFVKKESPYAIVFIAAIAIACEAIMVGGYFAFEWIFFGLPVAVADVTGNVIQGVFGSVAGTLFISVIVKPGLFDRLAK